MFSKNVIDSDMFLDMPLSTQALYFHLSMRADDDGFVNNPKKIMRMIGAADDSLKLLITKQFIIPFESGIVVIRHWKIHNYIQKDRYKPTSYQTEKKLLEEDINGSYIPIEYSTGTDCIQNVYNSDTQVRIEQDKSDKVNQSKDTLGKNAERIVALFNEICPSLQKVIKVSDARKKTIATITKAFSDEEIKTVFEKAEKSDFLTGKTKPGFKAAFDWIMKQSNFIKVLEGNYDNYDNKQDAHRSESNESIEDKYRKLGRPVPSYNAEEIELESYEMYKD
jgi:hypothetical protein